VQGEIAALKAQVMAYIESWNTGHGFDVD